MAFRRFAATSRPAIINGVAGFVAFTVDRPYAVLAFTVRGDRIVEIDVLADPARLRNLDLAVLDA
jgi:RNA polymerase sigma-70 factor (ECF subfamily)